MAAQLQEIYAATTSQVTLKPGQSYTFATQNGPAMTLQIVNMSAQNNATFSANCQCNPPYSVTQELAGSDQYLNSQNFQGQKLVVANLTNPQKAANLRVTLSGV